MTLIEFDPAKNDENRRKHGIDLAQFVEMDLATVIAIEDTRRDYGETRLRLLGLIGARLFAAVITPRGDKIRVISLRRANRREERAYAKERQTA